MDEKQPSSPTMDYVRQTEKPSRWREGRRPPIAVICVLAITGLATGPLGVILSLAFGEWAFAMMLFVPLAAGTLLGWTTPWTRRLAWSGLYGACCAVGPLAFIVLIVLPPPQYGRALAIMYMVIGAGLAAIVGFVLSATSAGLVALLVGLVRSSVRHSGEETVAPCDSHQV